MKKEGRGKQKSPFGADNEFYLSLSFFFFSPDHICSRIIINQQNQKSQFTLIERSLQNTFIFIV